MDLEEKLERCRETDFLAPLADEELRRLVEESRELQLAQDELLFDEGEEGHAMYLVLRGRLLVFKGENRIAEAPPGTYVGEMAIVESKVRSASVKALEPTSILEITERQFQRFVASNPQALMAIMKTLSVRSRNDLAVLDTSFRQLKAYSDEVEQTNQELQQIRQQLMRSNRELERLSTLDQLTGLANRRRFDVALRYEWRRAGRDETALSLILCDIDCFKDYNDTYGHPAGDEVLVRVADAFTSTFLRAADLAARYGGEEFAVILANTNAEDARRIAEKLRERIERLRIPHQASPVAAWVTVSLGVATMVPHRDTEPDILIARADKALYAAKQSGRNRVAAEDPHPAPRA